MGNKLYSKVKRPSSSLTKFDIKVNVTTWIGHKGVGGFQKSYIIFGGGMSNTYYSLQGWVGGLEKAKKTLP